MGGEGDRPVDAYLRNPWFLFWGLLAGTALPCGQLRDWDPGRFADRAWRAA